MSKLHGVGHGARVLAVRVKRRVEWRDHATGAVLESHNFDTSALARRAAEDPVAAAVASINDC
jgi:hypothetical protein